MAIFPSHASTNGLFKVRPENGAQQHSIQNKFEQPQWAGILAVGETPVKIKSLKTCELQRECSSERGSAGSCTTCDAKLHK
jgi:hypothetical protein